VQVKIAKNAVLDPDMTQEEMDDMLKALQDMVDNGTLDSESKPVDMDRIKDEDPALYDILISALDEVTEH